MELVNQSADRDNFTMVPNFVYRLGMSPYAVALYGYIKQAAGETGRCFKSTKTIAEELCMSAGSVSAAKEELEQNELIKIHEVKRPQGGKPYHSIAILDVWQRNYEFIATHKVRSQGEPTNSQDEIASSQGEINKNPSINNPEVSTSTAAAVAESPNVFRTYEQEIGLLTLTISEELKDAEKEYPADWITDALKIAARQNKRNWAYAAAILKRWTVEGRGAAKPSAGARPGAPPRGGVMDIIQQGIELNRRQHAEAVEDG